MLIHTLHRTSFLYAGDAHESFNEVRLRPRDGRNQSCRAFALRVEPEGPIRDYEDFHGNTVHFFEVPGVHRRLVIEARSEVETVPDAQRPPVPVVPHEAIASMRDREMYAEFYSDSRYVPLAPELWREAVDALGSGRADIWGDACRLGSHVYRTLAYRPNATGVTTRATDALSLRAGVCQDFAHVMLGLCRCAEIPARYVSGYFLNSDRRPGEVEASHAWVEVFVPGHGWAAYDPTHDRPAGEIYVKVAVGRDYGDICPVSGTYRGAPTEKLLVEVEVTAPGAATAAPWEVAATPS
jgi:transglutaminase-like putative cysteine protease